MNRFLIIFIIIIYSSFAYTQNINIEELIKKGTIEHDSKNYNNAILCYDSILSVYPQNNVALIEKAITFSAMKKHDESIALCKQALSILPNIDVEYITLGINYCQTGKCKDAIKIYDEGLAIYPECDGLYYNKGVALFKLGKYKLAEICFQEVLKQKDHFGSYKALAEILYKDNMTVSLLCYFKMNILNPNNENAEYNYKQMQSIFHRYVTYENSKPVITMPRKIVNHFYKGVVYENNFEYIVIGISYGGAFDYSTAKDTLNQAQILNEKISLVCSILEKENDRSYGFYWENIANYFIELEKSNNIETASYLICSYSKDVRIQEWLRKNNDKILLFKEWNNNYK